MAKKLCFCARNGESFFESAIRNPFFLHFPSNRHKNGNDLIWETNASKLSLWRIGRLESQQNRACLKASKYLIEFMLKVNAWYFDWSNL